MTDERDPEQDDEVESGMSDADRPDTPQIDPPEDDR
jgi:hypothetical protein